MAGQGTSIKSMSPIMQHNPPAMIKLRMSMIEQQQGYKLIRTSYIALLLLAAIAANADTEIHKCVDADGNTAYQQMPCPPVKDDVAEDAEQVEEVSQAPIVGNRTHEEIEACKDPLRDGIDEIEAEMLRGFSAEESDAYKAKLRTLTQEMRACG